MCVQTKDKNKCRTMQDDNGICGLGCGLWPDAGKVRSPLFSMRRGTSIALVAGGCVVSTFVHLRRWG